MMRSTAIVLVLVATACYERRVGDAARAESGSVSLLEVDWARGFGGVDNEGTGENGALAVATDADGRVYASGRFEGEMNLGCGALTRITASAAFLVAYDADGGCLWSRTLSATSNIDAVALAAQDGRLVLGGSCHGRCDLGSGPREMEEVDGFLAAYDAGGEVLWTRLFAGRSHDAVTAVRAAPDGDLVVAGWFNETLPIEPGFDLISHGENDVLLLKLGPGGEVRWSRQLGGPKRDYPWGLDVGSDGTIALTGSVSGTVDLGEGALTGGESESDAFVAVYSANGDQLWSRRFIAADWSLGEAVAVGPDASVTLAVEPHGPMDVGGGLISSQYGQPILARFSSAGTLLWTRVDDVTSPTGLVTLAVDRFGHLLLAGPAETLTIASFDEEGGLLDSWSAGGCSVYGSGMASADGKLVVAGWYNGECRLPLSLPYSPGSNAFVAVLSY